MTLLKASLRMKMALLLTVLIIFIVITTAIY